MVDSTVDINSITWRTPDGEPYTLSGPDVDNGDAYMAPLPNRILLDPALLGEDDDDDPSTETPAEAPGASPSHVWWSTAGNDFGCNPAPSARSLDIPLDVLADVAPGTTVELEIDSYWDIEWDFDYGFLLVTTDDGLNYTSVASEEGYTLPADENPYGVACQQRYGNGLTGSSGSWEAGTEVDDRANGFQTPGTGFIPVTYDLTEFVDDAAASGSAAIRFHYNTDVGFTRPVWFVDDVRVTTGDGEVLYESNFEGEESSAGDDVVNGGCDADGLETGPCTQGWQYIAGGQENVADHAYYFELRDRTGFDFDSRGESDRGDIDWTPGVSLAYTDEARGYGNVQEAFRPNQHVLDSEPVPFGTTADFFDSLIPDLTDAAWTPTDEPFDDLGDGHEDNYVEFDEDTGDPIPWVLNFGCLFLEVDSMTGEDIGPSGPPGNLRADISTTRGDGCGERDYGYGQLTNGAPTAIGQVRETTVDVGEKVIFDGSMSFDDLTPVNELEYEWDFDGDGTTDATGQQATHAFDEAGIYSVTLTVTDEGGLSSSDTLDMTVNAEPFVRDVNSVSRLAGDNRIATAIAVSKAAFEMADAVVLSRADDFPDALAGATLAAEVGGPVLLTNSDGLDFRVGAELVRLGVDTVYLAGGEAALSPQVALDLGVLGVDIQRIGGAERNETAANIARTVVALGGDVGGDVGGAIVVRNDEFADALGAGNLATCGREPILLTQNDSLPEVTRTVLEDLVPAGDVTVVGGTAVVGDAVVTELEAGGHTVARLAGGERIATALAVAEEAMTRGADPEPSMLASAFNYPDALAGAPAAHEMGGLLLLTHPEVLEDDSALHGFLTDNAEEIDTLYILGGELAVSADIDSIVLRAIRAEGEE